ncbi:HNH endonuclease [Corallincola luteus]|uniref:HNH endonuclease n=1 Tax=Corallincola luteus TaxID=1775177 RepID=A0ABY2AKF1_9GAMM|nr:HNH endonuclease [Corallincola luteus]
MRNPKWSRDELILALDLYFKLGPNNSSATHPAVEELSETLNSLPIHPGASRVDKFRNANGVYMKMCNFLRFDPSYSGSGLKGGGKLEEEIWDEFASNIGLLAETAEIIKSKAGSVSPPVSEEDEKEEKVDEFPEGRVITKLHIRRERSSTLIKKKKEKVLSDTGALKCEACNFDFKDTYGSDGEGYIECHHNKPLSELKSTQKTKLEDLAVLCANCHRIIHRSRPWKTVAELKAVISPSIKFELQQ